MAVPRSALQADIDAVSRNAPAPGPNQQPSRIMPEGEGTVPTRPSARATQRATPQRRAEAEPLIPQLMMQGMDQLAQTLQMILALKDLDDQVLQKIISDVQQLGARRRRPGALGSP